MKKADIGLLVAILMLVLWAVLTFVVNDAPGVTHALLVGRLAAELGLDACKTHEWAVDSGGSSLFGELSYVVESHTVKTPEAWLAEPAAITKKRPSSA